MVTYLIGTDGLPASEAISDYLGQRVDKDDYLEVINVIAGGRLGDGSDERRAGEEALDLFEERFGEETSVTTRQFNRGRSPTDELIQYADEIDADQIVTALRRHSRTERIIVGSVAHSLIQRTTRPLTLVPLKEYQPPTEEVD